MKLLVFMANLTMLVEWGRGMEVAPGKIPDSYCSSQEVQLFYMNKLFLLCFFVFG